MKKIPYAISGVLIGFVAVVTLHPAGAPMLTAAKSSTGAGPSRPASVSSSPPQNATGPVGPSAPSSAPSTSSSGSQVGQQSGTSGVTPSSTSTTQASSNQGIRSATGASEQYGYGVISVTVTVDNQRITNVSVANLQVAESYSQSIAQQVIPMLKRQVLAAQSPNINGISGATYTAEAYATSVQSALNKLHFS